MMRLCVFTHVCIECCCGYMRGHATPGPCNALEMLVHFDAGRAVSGAPEGCARCLMCRCEHILNAKIPGTRSWPQSMRGTSAVV